LKAQCFKKMKLEPWRRSSLLNPRIDPGLTGGQFNLKDFAAHFHNPLLFPEPAIKGNQLGKKSILKLTLSPNPGLAGNTGRHLKHPHNLGFSSMDGTAIQKQQSLGGKNEYHRVRQDQTTIKNGI
jgi:hypothetical protein